MLGEANPARISLFSQAKLVNSGLHLPSDSHFTVLCHRPALVLLLIIIALALALAVAVALC